MSIMAPGTYVTPASPTVVNQINRLNNLADELIDKTESAVEGLQQLTFSNADLDPRLTWDEGDLDSLLNQLGTVPGLDPNTDWVNGLDLSSGNENFAFDPSVLALLSQQLPEYVLPALPALPTFPAAPVDPGEPGDLTAPERPTLGEYAAPNVDVDEVAPEFLDYTRDIPFPTMREISLPVPPVLALNSITFDGVKPTFAGNIPDPAEYEFNGTEYTPILMENVKTAILAILAGEKGMPPSIEDAIFERARERENELAERDVSTVSGEFAAKGYRQPPGAHAARVDTLRNEASRKISQINREQTIEGWKIQIDLFKDALASAIQLEDLWLRQYTTGERLRFESAQMRLTFAMQIFNAYVERFNAEASMFQAEAAVYRDRIAGEVAKIQAYTAELEAKRIIGELNAQDVQVYVERVRSLAVNADIYKARVDGYVAKFEAVNARVDVYKAQLESNKTLVEVYDTETRAFATMATAQTSRDSRFGIKADIYAKTVDARKTESEAILSFYETNFKKAELKRDTFVANSERVKEMISAESGRIRALTEKYQALASEIGAKSEVEKAKYALLLNIAQARIARMQAAAEILLKNGEINIQSYLSAEGLMLKAKETATTTLAQLAAGFTSAANVSASIGDTSGSSLSYNFSGELDVN